MLKKIIKFFLIIIIFAILALIGLIVSFKLDRRADFKMQEEFISQLDEYGRLSASIPDEKLDDSLRINEIKYPASHNSYHHQAGALQLLLINLFESGEAYKYMYSHQNFSRQLDIGIRSFELDIRSRRGRFENCHVPLVDNRTHSPSVELALAEMISWSDRHPGHIPVILLIELKDDWSGLDPLQKKWSAEEVEKLDLFLNEQLGDRLFTPSDLKGTAVSVNSAIISRGWPELGSLRGRFMVVYHETEEDYFTAGFLAGEDRAAFIMADAGSSEASFILRNDPYSEDISELIDAGYIVRTRADADCLKDEERKNAALKSGAQIVSTDFPKGYSSNSDYSLGWFEFYK